ncbi:MAG: ATP-binding domain-containing protein, partial [Halobacteriota archaeon]
LCVTRENEFSVNEINMKIEKILKEEFRGKDLFVPEKGFYHNQPIIVTRNDYSLNVVNGDVGIIRKEGDIQFAYFEDAEKGVKTIQAGYLSYYKTVFAMTIHKSQGSEFNNVVVILPEKQGEKLLTRELLYTGVTRAKNYVLIQTTEEVLRKCIERGVSRASGLVNQVN